MIKLVGVLIVAVGFALRFNTLLVVMAAGITTGMVAGLSFNEVMALFGKYFVESRYVTLTVVLVLPGLPSAPTCDPVWSSNRCFTVVTVTLPFAS